jgi:hypothetical protein
MQARQHAVALGLCQNAAIDLACVVALERANRASAHAVEADEAGLASGGCHGGCAGAAVCGSIQQREDKWQVALWVRLGQGPKACD